MSDQGNGHDGFVRTIPKERLELSQALARQHMEEEQARIAQKVERNLAPVQNVDTVVSLTQTAILIYRRGTKGERRFYVPPVSYVYGLQLQRLSHAIRRIQAEYKEVEEQDDARLAMLDEALPYLKATVALFHQMVKPYHLVDRLLWRWLSNPFGNASHAEVMELFGFFSACRMASSVRHGGWK